MTSASQLLAFLEGIDEGSFTNEEERVRVRDALFETLRKVQSPWYIVWDHNWTLIKAGLFNKWAECGGESKTCTELAEHTYCFLGILERLMRQISGQHLVIETAADTFSPTPWATALATDTSLRNVYGELLPRHLAVSPEIAADFHCAMEGHSTYNLTSWTEVYPTNTIVEAAKPGIPLVVDIGGSKGHDLEKPRLCHPAIPDGSLILQDLPDVLQDLKANKAITITIPPHDFFTPQPVLGARVYFMHNVLHDWMDELVGKILGNVACAIEKGVKPLARVTVSDITMMACLSGKERTEGEWRDLVEGAGLRVVSIWRSVTAVQSVIEAELV
ncbi:O-methyltransferase [Cadophora sp. DSE1049]|nr:O-methyltransferase [Cadophora sp. DSE1049]